jgi:hypothetical protein
MLDSMFSVWSKQDFNESQDDCSSHKSLKSKFACGRDFLLMTTRRDLNFHLNLNCFSKMICLFFFPLIDNDDKLSIVNSLSQNWWWTDLWCFHFYDDKLDLILREIIQITLIFFWIPNFYRFCIRLWQTAILEKLTDFDDCYPKGMMQKLVFLPKIEWCLFFFPLIDNDDKWTIVDSLSQNQWFTDLNDGTKQIVKMIAALISLLSPNSRAAEILIDDNPQGSEQFELYFIPTMMTQNQTPTSLYQLCSVDNCLPHTPFSELESILQISFY